MKKFIRKEYVICSSKIRQAEQSPVMVMISDLHNTEFGNNNDHLLREIELLQPDGILIGGDLIVGKKGHSVKMASQLIHRLSSVAPIFYAMGNHESRMQNKPDEMGEEYRAYEQVLKEENVIVLDNACASIEIKGTKFSIHGLSLPKKYYKKNKRETLFGSEVKEFIGEPDKDAYEILLAHNPRYAPAYFEWGADLILSGHYHGGMVRLGNHGVISPYFTLFPKYCYGRFDREQQTMLVSAGMGEHTIPFRMFNPRELLVLRFNPLEEKCEEK